ncbi:MAG: glycoside hydrolase family 57, partial [Candidatus Omnitrophota bacterium]
MYTIFHCNIFYSSIPEEKRKDVIRKCYWPILELAEARNVPIGVEISGCSLEVVTRLDPAWIKKFKKLLRGNACELIGSGYMQIIGPLV